MCCLMIDSAPPQERATSDGEHKCPHILARLGRVEEARNAARRALELQPGYPEAASLLQSLSQ